VDSFEKEVGHPGERWAALKERVQHENIRRFAAIQSDFLALVWSLDQYRARGVVPRNMGKAQHPAERRLEAVYRSKGNWLAHLVAQLLENQTTSRLAPRSNVQGFSQQHQIDVAWPARGGIILDPLVCVETKMTGAPATGSTPERGALADFTNRRKELKFAATDLKLYRRQQETRIDHWDTWRRREPPKTYFLWCARMAARDKIDTLVGEVRLLTDTYLDGAGLFAYRVAPSGSGYVPVTISQRARVAQLDDVLHRIANEINDMAGADGAAPPARVVQHPVAGAAEIPDE
jgi:hypothetical protein